MRVGRPLKAYQKWIQRIPTVYGDEVLGPAREGPSATVDGDECLATLTHYRSLMAMARDARKPMFHLRAADGALGGHIHAVQDCFEHFETLAGR